MIEIERKFEVSAASRGWRLEAVRSLAMKQGYFPGEEVSVRVRIAGEAAWLTVKSHGNGVSRPGFEYAIPVADAEAMLAQFCGGRVIEKTRWYVPAAEPGLEWEIDEYHGPFEGHFTAELEIPDEGFAFRRPVWLGRELTYDPRYTNAALAVAQKWPE
jgi:CYTH domain-containing protein